MRNSCKVVSTTFTLVTLSFVSITLKNLRYRYDGIYKVVKYYPKHGANGLLVWRFLLRRDDPEPAPWTEEGKRIIEEKFLRMIVSFVRY